MFARFVFFCKFVPEARDTTNYSWSCYSLQWQIVFVTLLINLWRARLFSCIQPLGRMPTHSKEGLINRKWTMKEL